MNRHDTSFIVADGHFLSKKNVWAWASNFSCRSEKDREKKSQKILRV